MLTVLLVRPRLLELAPALTARLELTLKILPAPLAPYVQLERLQPLAQADALTARSDTSRHLMELRHALLATLESTLQLQDCLPVCLAIQALTLLRLQACALTVPSATSHHCLDSLPAHRAVRASTPQCLGRQAVPAAILDTSPYRRLLPAAPLVP